MAGTQREPLPVASTWIQVAILTFLLGFGILGYLAYRIYADQPPVPGTVTTGDGTVLFGRAEIETGQLVFEKYGLMEHGTIFGTAHASGPTSPPTTSSARAGRWWRTTRRAACRNPRPAWRTSSRRIATTRGTIP